MSQREQQSSSGGIAVIGLGCRYPGARGPREFWENVLARRRQFRKTPACRLPLAEYHDPDPSAPDRTYGRRAAVIDGFQFDWAGMRIPRRTFEATDVVQWLALDVARQALADAGYSRETVARDRTGVILGNTLTGEHTRANSMRLRWPFVRRALMAAADRKGLPLAVRDDLAVAMERCFKSVFPDVTEDTLAGGLSNTIAGRICNTFDFHGGGYTVDGACSSSLLAVCTAADRLAAGDLDLAMAGGVDVSLDAFELIGFAKTGALTPDDMRVYDRRADGFLPGEGCGFVVLKRLADARADGDRVYAVLRGWGISSDGKGGMTAPSRDGQATAIRRAYERAGYGPDRLDFVEGHGTGTKVGDRVELEGLAAAFSAFGAEAQRSCGITSLKSIVGHTKAAAGVGALIKAAIAVNRRVIPPTAGCSRPSEVFDATARVLYPVLLGEVREPSRTVRAGVSAMGFGGINSHVALESGDAPDSALAPSLDERSLLASAQETEVFVFGASSSAELLGRLRSLETEVEALSQAELTDLAARLGSEVGAAPAVRAAVIAGTPDELAGALRELADALGESAENDGRVLTGPGGRWWVGRPSGTPRIGFLFPGQGSQQLGMARNLVERLAWARKLAADADRWAEEFGAGAITPLIHRPLDRATGPEQVEDWRRDLARTETAQPAICLASAIFARRLADLGLVPTVVGGHSLGELSAFHAAGALDAEALLKLASARGRVLAAPADRPGAMASLACSADEAEALFQGVGGVVVVANLNGPGQTVVSGEEAAVLDVASRAAERGVAARRLPVSNAFHSPLLAEAAARLESETRALVELGPTSVPMLSSTDGRPVAAGLDLGRHLASQVTARVEFSAMVERMAADCDLLVEVGPGAVLSGLTARIVGPEGPPCLPVASKPEAADRDLNAVLARAFVLGADVHWERLHDGRLIRPYVPASERLFLDNPCERPFSDFDVEPLTGDPALSGSLEAVLAEAAGVAPERMRAYLDRRRRFLADVVRADLHDLDGAAEEASLSPRASTSKPPEPPKARPAAAPLKAARPGGQDLDAALLDLAAERTGFPRESLSLDVRLLDDLNLDSIKAAELAACAAKSAGVAGRIDPSEFANASLSEISAAIRQAQAGDRGPAERAPERFSPTAPSMECAPTIDAGPSWVRNFVIEYVSEPV